jgi:hypothetical protein
MLSNTSPKAPWRLFLPAWNADFRIVREIHVNPTAIEIGDVASHVLAELLVDSHRALHVVGRVKVGIDRISCRRYGTDGSRVVGHWLIRVIEVRIVDGKAPLIRNL